MVDGATILPYSDAVRIGHDALAQSLLGLSDEALIISVHRTNGESRVAVHHKFKDREGVLNAYLTTMLEELLGRCDAKANQADSQASGELTP